MIKKIAALLIIIIVAMGCTGMPRPTQKGTTEDELYNEAMSYYRKNNFYLAVPVFQAVRDRFPLSPYAIQAELRLADCNYLEKNHIEAVYQYEEFRKLHPANSLIPYAIYQTGMCHFKQILTVDRDQTETEKAAEEFEYLISRFPQNPYAGMALSRLKSCKKRIAEHEFIIGTHYLKFQNYKGAIDRFNLVAEKYPLEIEKDKILFNLGKAYMLTGDKGQSGKLLSDLIKQYPQSEYVREAKVLLGVATEKEKEELKKEKKFFLF